MAESLHRRKILFVAAAWPPYRAPEADHALQECVHLAEQGLEVHVLTTRRAEVARPEGVTVHDVIDDWSMSELGKVATVIRAVRPDAGFMFFLGHLYYYSKMATLIPALFRLLRPRAPFVSQFSNLGKGAPKGDDLKTRIKREAFHRAGRWRYGSMLVLSDRILLMSRPHLKRLARIHPSLLAKAELVPPPSLVGRLDDAVGARLAGRESLGVSSETFLFTYFSRLYPAKGIETLLRAFRQVVDELPQARLAMVGGYHSADAWWQDDDYPTQLARLVDELDLREQVIWTGEYDWEGGAASEYLHASDVAILPFDRGVYLHNSSFAAVAAHGLPAIVTAPRGGFEPEIVPGDNVYGIEPRDQDALRDGMLELRGDAELRARLGKGAADLAYRWFSWDGCTTAIRSALRV
ncbi:MAG: glycosyltransferase family 4 protein [Egibacteraceae bacterium]